MTATMKETYAKHAVPALRKTFDVRNAMAIPRIVKVVVNTGSRRRGR